MECQLADNIFHASSYRIAFAEHFLQIKKKNNNKLTREILFYGFKSAHFSVLFVLLFY